MIRWLKSLLVGVSLALASVPVYAQTVVLINRAGGQSCVATPAGHISSKFCEDGDDGSGSPPTAPEIGLPVAVDDDVIDIPLITDCTGGTAPYTYELNRSVTSQSSGFSVVASATTLFDVDGVYTLTGNDPETQYWFKLACIDDDSLRSDFSLVRSVTTPAVVGGDVTAPTVPASLLAVSTESGHATLTWPDSADAVGVTRYDVLRGDANGSGVPINEGSVITSILGTPPSTGYEDSGLVPGQEYFYRVRAGDAADNLSAYATADFVTIEGDSLGTVLAGDNWENRAVGAKIDTDVFVPMALGGNMRGSISGDQSNTTRMPTIVSSPVFEGTRAVQFFIPGNATNGDPQNDRSEMSFSGTDIENTDDYQNVEHCIGWTETLDGAFPITDVNAVTTVLFQQHTVTGQPGKSPLWGLRIRNKNEYWITTEVGSVVNFYLGRTINADRGVARRWVFHVKYNDAGAGWIKTYVDGVLIHDTGNFTTVPPGTTEFGFYKIGLYAAAMSTRSASARRTTVDALRFGKTAAECPAVVDPDNY